MKYATLRETKKEGERLIGRLVEKSKRVCQEGHKEEIEKEIDFFITMNRKYKNIMKGNN